MPRPADLSLLTALIGPNAVRALVREFGGIPVLIPKRCDGSAYAALEEVAGAAAANALVKHFHGEVLAVPKCQAQALSVRNAIIRAAYDDGSTARDLARQHDLSVRQVWNVLGSLDEVTERQGALF